MYLRVIAESRNFLIRLVPLLLSSKWLKVGIVIKKICDYKRKKKGRLRSREMYAVLPAYLLLRTINVG